MFDVNSDWGRGHDVEGGTGKSRGPIITEPVERMSTSREGGIMCCMSYTFYFLKLFSCSFSSVFYTILYDL